MNNTIIGVAILACTAAAALWLGSAQSAYGPDSKPGPLPVPAPSQGPNLLGVFQENGRPEAKSEAVWLAAFFHSLADQVEYDEGKRFRTWKDFDSQRADALDLHTRGKRYARNYPSLGKVVASFLDRPGGNPKLNETISLTDRNEVISKYRALGDSCLSAAGKL